MHENDVPIFVNGLEKLLAEKRFDDESELALWYELEWSKRSEMHFADLTSDRENNAFWHRISYLLVLGSLYMFIALMAFIAFPLLIRIERNTRWRHAEQ